MIAWSKNKVPNCQGVYFFKKGRKILYIGKATSLRERMRSYFVKDIGETRGPLIVQMLQEANHVNWQTTDSVLEALILEAQLIKKHQPVYNTKEKSDKSFNYIVITNESYPRIFTVRERELITGKTHEYRSLYGPFPYGTQLKTALSIIRKLFPFLGKGDIHTKTGQRRSRLNEELGLAPALSQMKVSSQEYAETIKHIELFLSGKKKTLLSKLKQNMKKHARVKEFEKAGEIKRRLFALQHINDVALLEREVSLSSKHIRIEAYDVAHLSMTNRVGVMVVFENGEPVKSQYRKFGIKTVHKGDSDALQEILERRLKHTEWRLPDCIVVDGNAIQSRVAEKIVAQYGYTIPVVAVVKNEQHKPKGLLGPSTLIRRLKNEILKANTEAHRFAVTYHRTKRKRGIR